MYAETVPVLYCILTKFTCSLIYPPLTLDKKLTNTRLHLAFVYYQLLLSAFEHRSVGAEFERETEINKIKEEIGVSGFCVV